MSDGKMYDDSGKLNPALRNRMIRRNPFDLSLKTAAVFGSSGNLGPIWCRTLEGAGACLTKYDPDGSPPPTDYPIDDPIPWNTHNTDIYVSSEKAYDIVLYNAAIDHPPGEGVNFWTDMATIIDVNLTGAMRVAETFVPNMAKNGGGVFLVVGSIQGFVGADYRNYEKNFEKPCAYNVSKAGLMQLVRSIAVQYGRYNVRAVGMAFAAVDTGKFKDPFRSKFLNCLPLGRFITPDSLSRTLLYACTCEELTGQTLLIDSGYTAW